MGATILNKEQIKKKKKLSPKQTECLAKIEAKAGRAV